MRSRELEISLPCLLEVRHAMGGMRTSPRAEREVERRVCQRKRCRGRMKGISRRGMLVGGVAVYGAEAPCMELECVFCTTR